MNVNSKILSFIKDNNNLITTSQFVKLGFSKTLLCIYEEEGLLERIGRGIYTLKDEIVDDMYLLMLKSKKIIFSHETSLFLNGISERTPFIHTVTIPSNSVLSKNIAEECKCYYIKPELHTMGLIEKKTTFGNTVRCYNLERTICDIIRNRNTINEETVLSSIKLYAKLKDKDLNLLMDYSQKLRVSNKVRGYMEVLL